MKIPVWDALLICMFIALVVMSWLERREFKKWQKSAQEFLRSAYAVRDQIAERQQVVENMASRLEGLIEGLQRRQPKP